MIKLNSVSAFLGNHIYRVLNPTVRNDRDTRYVDHTKILHAVNLEARVNHTLLNILGQTGGTTSIERGLGRQMDGAIGAVSGAPLTVSTNTALTASSTSSMKPTKTIQTDYNYGYAGTVLAKSE